MQILSSFNHHQVVQICTSFFQQKKIFWSPNKSRLPSAVVTNILQNIFFCVLQNKETHTGLEQMEGE